MDLTQQLDGYCERLDPSFWAEPINALTNAAFLIAAFLMWRRSSGLPLARALCIVLATIGLGSFAFHTWAQTWAAIADVAPILVYILLYLFAINRDVWGLPGWRGAALTALFIPYAAALVPVFSLIPGIGGSAGYAPVPLLIFIYAVLLRHRHPEIARGLAIGGAILCVSLTLRTLDLPLCDLHPIGTHYWWHILNGIMLGWMIEVYRRHMLAGGGEER